MNPLPLKIATVDRMHEGERGGVAVVLLHGWGAPGDDLVPLAEELARPGTRFFLPAGPLPEMGGGRAWWHLGADRPEHAGDDVPASARPVNAQLKAARAGIQGLLNTIKERHDPKAIYIAGFSQGAMLSLDVALTASPPVDRAAAMSGLLLADSAAALHAQKTSRPRIFMSHGRSDAVVPFAGAQRAKGILERSGFTMTWCPFDGGHEIPQVVVRGLTDFLYGEK